MLEIKSHHLGIAIFFVLHSQNWNGLNINFIQWNCKSSFTHFAMSLIYSREGGDTLKTVIVFNIDFVGSQTIIDDEAHICSWGSNECFCYLQNGDSMPFSN